MVRALSDEGFKKLYGLKKSFSIVGTSTRLQKNLTMVDSGSMEALDFINNRYSVSQGSVKQHPQFDSEMYSNNSNNNNNINVNHL